MSDTLAPVHTRHATQAWSDALHLRRVGFDPVTGIVHQPDALPEGEIHGCGGASCSGRADSFI
jgi:hypothetical protein